MGCVKKKCAPQISSGDMKTLVTVQRQIDAPAAGAGFSRVYVTVGTVWCKLEQTSGREDFEDQQLRQKGDHKFSTRWPNVVALGLKDTDRFTVVNPLDAAHPHIYQIRSIQDVEYKGTVALILAERNVPT